MTQRVTVIGAGVIGLSCAQDLAAAGHVVSVVADVDTPNTVSAVAAALWFPYRSERSAAADELLHRSLARFMELLDVPEAGVSLHRGTVIERRTDADRSWVAALPGFALTQLDKLPPGAIAGVDAVVPVINTPVYLRWLRGRVIDRGVRMERRTVHNLAELAGAADLVVVAGGIRGGDLLGGDPEVYPIRGQVVRVANPGLTEWINDDDNPDGVVYVIPRGDDVIVGGVAEAGSWDTAVYADVQDAILRRAARLVPELAGSRILEGAAGLRPARETVRLERVAHAPVPAIAAYGHGGAGVTLSWGTAERVVDLACGP